MEDKILTFYLLFGSHHNKNKLGCDRALAFNDLGMRTVWNKPSEIQKILSSIHLPSPESSSLSELIADMVENPSPHISKDLKHTRKIISSKMH